MISMRFLILGRGKTGSLVAEVAAERKHHLRIAGAKENPACAALTKEKLHDIDAVIDFTTPHCVVANIEACVKAGKNMVVGTTGWYNELDRIRGLVEQHKTGFVYAANFSVGVNLFFDVARAAAAVADGFVVRSPKAYPVIERGYADKVAVIKGWLDRFENFLPIGRSGMFKYNNQDHAMATGLLAARTALGLGHFDPWLVNIDGLYQEGGKA